MIAINLAPVFWREKRRRAKRTRRWVAALAVAWAASGVAVIGVRFGMMNASSSVSTGVVELQVLEAELAAARTTLANAQVDLSRQQAIGEHPDWSVMFTAIASSARDRAGVRRVDIQTGPNAAETATLGTVRIAGVAWTQADASAFVIALDELGIFRQVDLQSIVREQVGGREGVGFTVTCILGE